MAKVVNITMRSQGRSALYAWDDWLDGQTWLLERGKDYNCTDSSMRSQASHVARTRGLRASVNHHKDGLVLKAFPK